MTYPVQPPEPPPIVKVVPSKQLAEPEFEFSSHPLDRAVNSPENGQAPSVSPPESIAPPSGFRPDPLSPEMGWVAPSANELLPPPRWQDKARRMAALESIENRISPEEEPESFPEIEFDERTPDLDNEAIEDLEIDEGELEEGELEEEIDLEDISPNLDLDDGETEDAETDENLEDDEIEVEGETPPAKQPNPPTVDGSSLQEPLELETPIEVTADYQEFDDDRQIFTARGNVVMRYRNTVIDADWLQVNLLTRMARAEGNVALTQPGQVLRGELFRYNFVQEIGTIEQARGEISSLTRAQGATPQTAPTAVPSVNTLLPVDIGARGLSDAPQSDRIAEEQPLNVAQGGAVQIGVGAGRGYQDAAGGGTINSFRFEAEQVEFTPDGWEGTGVRITNDPFSPPELEIRAERATLTPIDPLRDELLLSRPRLVFDDGFSLPILKRRYVIDRRERQEPFLEFGFDREDRGGFFIQRSFSIVNTPRFSLRVAPQYFVQQGYDERNLLDLDQFGSLFRFQSIISPTTTLRAEGSLTSLDFGGDFDPDDDLRASARLSQKVANHTLTGEYSFRNRLFNGSLGFQTVHSSVGVVLTSPRLILGRTGIDLEYQLGVNRVEADTDDLDLLEPIRDNNRATLTRFQGSFVARRGFTLWQGEALPATAEEGLRFSPVPVIPFVRFYVGARGIGGFYSNGDSEVSLRGTAGLEAQFGHFSRNFLDYTAFNLEYSETLQEGESPFYFDRVADRRVLRFGFTQQLVGPFRFGVQASVNLDSGENFSTNLVLEYSRRTHGIILLVNPEREIGSLTFRISDFDWNGNTGAFSDTETCEVTGGLRCDR
ncbi:DUF3769 domain-containing protein [Baaleninema sp.]|uniref:DUF3769 domain-containing protein n=1 Tax=Baaleninema sp. TaxID=3101197 RepID=UPI003CFF1E9D